MILQQPHSAYTVGKHAQGIVLGRTRLRKIYFLGNTNANVCQVSKESLNTALLHTKWTPSASNI